MRRSHSGCTVTRPVAGGSAGPGPASDKGRPSSDGPSAGGGCTGIYRGLLLWAAAVSEAGTLRQDAVLRALDHARIPQGPGGGAEMAPGQHHLQLNMYIAQATKGRLKVVKNLGHIAPKERLVASAA
jgi:branched-chain amino acid transport system substrate-binding protein